MFYELFGLCKTALALPVSTAACERSFSALKLIKNPLRTTMNNERLSDLGVLSMESKRAKALDMDEFVRLFSSKHGNRKIVILKCQHLQGVVPFYMLLRMLLLLSV